MMNLRMTKKMYEDEDSAVVSDDYHCHFMIVISLVVD